MTKVVCCNCNKNIKEENAWKIQLGTQYRTFCSKECAMTLIENHITEQCDIIKYLMEKLIEIRQYNG